MTLKQTIQNISTAPGVYLYKDSRGAILYVGKAKSLRPRVQSYFRDKADLDPAKAQMIPNIADIETITTDTETEALVLEANLIRQHQPPYNVVLRDDKYYLFIKITTNEDRPRVFPVRRIKKDGARYFGPYSSAASVRQTLKLLRRIFPHHGEKESPREKIFPHPLFDQRLESGNYQLNIDNVIRFLTGHRKEIISTLRDGMNRASRRKQYERAAIFRDQLRAIERLEGNQKVYLPRQESFDVISIAPPSGQARLPLQRGSPESGAQMGGRATSRSAANIFAIREGKLLGKNTFLLQHRQSAQPEDILRQFLLQYYRVAQDIPRTILIPLTLDDQPALAAWINAARPPILTTPRRGKKRQLLSMGEMNAQQLLDQEEAVFVTDSQLKQAAKELAEALNIRHQLHRIETYDISNIQGALATGSMVVFTDGKPDKSQYKKFKIKLGDTPNDFAMLQEVLGRRFSGRHQSWRTPDLILIDGGRGQLSAARQILTDRRLSIPVASLAKREEELFTAASRQPVRLPYDSPALHLVQRMRDEAHRFTITYHRLLRHKRQQRSILDEVPGIGPKLKKKLLNHFGSLKAIRAAPDDEIAQLIGHAKTKSLRDYL